MKRQNNVFEQICSLENLQLADAIARQGKSDQYGIKTFDKNPLSNLLALQDSLLNRTYKTSTYNTFTILEPKERQICSLPYDPDRILHHAIMNIIEKPLVASFTADTYSCIKNRGISAAVDKVKKALKNKEATKYCLKLDIKKFYGSVDHDVLKKQVRRKFKDKDLFWLLDEIIDSAPGLPIGNYLSQYFSNLNLTPFDYWLKQQIGKLKYFRYADDIVIFAPCKKFLHDLLHKIIDYLKVNLKLDVKHNYQVFPVAARGVDFCGFVFFHDCVYMRKGIKQGFARAVAKYRRRRKLYRLPPTISKKQVFKAAPGIGAYMGWTKPANTRHLIKKLLPYAGF